MVKLFLIIAFIFFAGFAVARDSSVRAAFLRAHGLTKTPKGCQVDHLMPLMFNGMDQPENLCLVCGDRLIAKEKAERDLSDLEAWFRVNREWLEENGCKSKWGRK